jgi:DNA repair protein RadC
MTKQIVEIARGLGIEVRDRIIVGRDGHASLKALRLIWAAHAPRTTRLS